ncbi:MAG: response regulator transcription factor [Anaerolineaceae bacterium]|nr:response regulator transcription factor [Anaerolineae bacterium]MDX9829349.1 response regulator transcription factor [Anaerolineae bacterium]NLF15532.1 response regulator transcription factor [Anaerolineaceae bacterium]
MATGGETAMRELKLIIVDDHAIFREGLRALLDMEEDFQVIGEASHGAEAVAMVAEEPPDVILLDLHLPDGLGSDFCRELLGVSPQSRVLILSAYDDDQEISAALIAGASGYVLKTVGGERLADNIRSVSRGEVLLAPTVAAKVVRQLSRLREEATKQEEALDGLTPREREVFFLASRGLRNSEIAEELYLSEKTIKTHLRNIYNKLNLTSKAELRLFAVRMGLVPDAKA